jgi:hypothetical protein
LGVSGDFKGLQGKKGNFDFVQIFCGGAAAEFGFDF